MSSSKAEEPTEIEESRAGSSRWGWINKDLPNSVKSEELCKLLPTTIKPLFWINVTNKEVIEYHHNSEALTLSLF